MFEKLAFQSGAIQPSGCDNWKWMNVVVVRCGPIRLCNVIVCLMLVSMLVFLVRVISDCQFKKMQLLWIKKRFEFWHKHDQSITSHYLFFLQTYYMKSWTDFYPFLASKNMLLLFFCHVEHKRLGNTKDQETSVSSMFFTPHLSCFVSTCISTAS